MLTLLILSSNWMEELDEVEVAAGRCGWGEMMSDMLANDTVSAKVSGQEERVLSKVADSVYGRGRGRWVVSCSPDVYK